MVLTPDRKADVFTAISHRARRQMLDLLAEAERLKMAGALTGEQTALLNLPALAAFWTSSLGQRIRAEEPFVQRELAFTARFAPNELAAFSGQASDPSLGEEFVVVQGVADLAVMRREEIWLVDFKTDRLSAEEALGRSKEYEPQLRLYARALSRIYRRPVTEAWFYFLGCGEAVQVEG